MKILLDECVPWPIYKLLAGHECIGVRQRGWAGFKNGALLKLAEGQFDLFITTDQNILYQQNLARGHVPILQLSTNNLRRIQAAAALILAALEVLQPGEFRQIEIP